MTHHTDAVFDRAETLATAATEYPELTPNYIEATKDAKELEGAPGWKGKRGMSQVEKILDHIRKTGSITQREAYLDYGVQSFTRRIADIRALGFPIVGVSKIHPVSKQEYTRYYLAEKAPKGRVAA